MKINPISFATSARRRLARAALALATVTVLGLPSLAQAQALYASPEAAADALIAAVATSDPDAMSVVLGKNWRKLVLLDEFDAEDRYAFLEKSAKSRAVKVKDGVGQLVVGADEWPFAIPIKQAKTGQWQFDLVGGHEAVLERRIGANERAAMQAVLAYVDAQRDYATADRNNDGMFEYAQKLMSSPGKRDGLIWSPSLGDESPLGESFLPARPGEGYHGYRFKILVAQGAKAKGGARSYFIGKRMVSGFALVAWPVSYGQTGVMSFIVSQAGKVYERDLGPNSAQAASAMTVFNPDEHWREAKP
jgi:Protein of unknown function (DUF2950)